MSILLYHKTDAATHARFARLCSKVFAGQPVVLLREDYSGRGTVVLMPALDGQSRVLSAQITIKSLEVVLDDGLIYLAHMVREGETRWNGAAFSAKAAAGQRGWKQTLYQYCRSAGTAMREELGL